MGKDEDVKKKNSGGWKRQGNEPNTGETVLTSAADCDGGGEEVRRPHLLHLLHLLLLLQPQSETAAVQHFLKPRDFFFFFSCLDDSVSQT